jgi:hypothetical protein
VDKALDELKTDVTMAIKKKLPVPQEEVQAAIGKWGVGLATLKDKLQGDKVSEAFGELKAMMTAIGAKKEEIAKLVASAPAAPEKKKIK